MSASLSDVLTTLKNGVTAISNAAQTYANVQGTSNVSSISAGTVVKASAGRVASVSVTTLGTSTGTIYDSSTATATRPIYVIPTAVGLYTVNLPASYGIYAVPGTGQVITVSYS